MSRTARVPSSNLQKHTSSNPLQKRLIDAFHRAVTGHIPPTPGKLLEVGCGEGFALRAVVVESCPLTSVGLDIEAGALEWARNLSPRSALVCGNALALPFPADSFDVVMCLEVLEHLEDPAPAIEELLRVCRGSLILSVPWEPWFRLANFLRGKNLARWGDDPGHVQHWSSRGFGRFVETRCDVLSSRVSWPWTIVCCQP